MKQLITILTVCVSVYLGLVGWQYFETLHLRQEPEVIRARILKQTPLGTDMETVMAFCLRVMSNCRANEDFGFERNDGTYPIATVGVKSINGYMGDYRYEGVFQTTVTANWGFNERGKLVDVWPDIDIDAL